jgi:hypothetical protein
MQLFKYAATSSNCMVLNDGMDEWWIWKDVGDSCDLIWGTIPCFGGTEKLKFLTENSLSLGQGLNLDFPNMKHEVLEAV